MSTSEMITESADSWREFTAHIPLEYLTKLTPQQLFEAGFASGFVKGGTGIVGIIKHALKRKIR